MNIFKKVTHGNANIHILNANGLLKYSSAHAWEQMTKSVRTESTCNITAMNTDDC